MLGLQGALHLFGAGGLPFETSSFLTGSTELISDFAAKSQTQLVPPDINPSRNPDPVLRSRKVPEEVFNHPGRNKGESGRILIVFIKIIKEAEGIFLSFEIISFIFFAKG